MHPFTKFLAIIGLIIALLVILNIVTRPVQAAGATRSAPHHHVDRQNSAPAQGRH